MVYRMADVGVARLMVVHFVVPEMASTILVQSAKAADAIKSNRGFSGLRKPFGTQREERQGPKIAAHFLYEQGRQVP